LFLGFFDGVVWVLVRDGYRDESQRDHLITWSRLMACFFVFWVF
jgi:hypothetical protein